LTLSTFNTLKHWKSASNSLIVCDFAGAAPLAF
jgi:hypothetical protein